MLTQPLDLVKTRLMTQGLRPSGLQVYRGVFDTLRTVVREEGVAGLSRGLGTRLLFTSSFNAIGFPVFEGAKGRLARRVGSWPRKPRTVSLCAALMASSGGGFVSPCCAEGVAFRASAARRSFREQQAGEKAAGAGAGGSGGGKRAAGREGGRASSASSATQQREKKGGGGRQS